MLQEIKLRYFNESLQIGLVNWREAYLLKPIVVKLLVEVDEGRLVYRVKGSGKRISYKQIKKGIRKQTIIIKEEVPSWFY